LGIFLFLLLEKILLFGDRSKVIALLDNITICDRVVGRNGNAGMSSFAEKKDMYSQ